MPACKFSTISERDMDLLILQSIVTDPDFLDLFLKKVGLTACSVLSVELSKIDAILGESDITVLLDNNGVRHALLIEDKINAIAMPNQHNRYFLRGEKGIKQSEYDAFDLFIICPRKYREINAEAKLYENYVSYEECLALFESKKDPISKVRAQQYSQVLEKPLQKSQTELNEAANSFFLNYKQFKDMYYPALNLRTSEQANGYWVEYQAVGKNGRIIHKIGQGYVDLTYNRTAEKIREFELLAPFLSEKVIAVVTGKSAAFRLTVPKMDVLKKFDDYDKQTITDCFEAISELTRIDKMIRMIKDL